MVEVHGMIGPPGLIDGDVVAARFSRVDGVVVGNWIGPPGLMEGAQVVTVVVPWTVDVDSQT